MIYSDLIGNATKLKNCSKIDENEFYYKLEQSKKNNNHCDEMINILDKYFQSDILKIYKYN